MIQVQFSSLVVVVSSALASVGIASVTGTEWFSPSSVAIAIIAFVDVIYLTLIGGSSYNGEEYQLPYLAGVLGYSLVVAIVVGLNHGLLQGIANFFFVAGVGFSLYIALVVVLVVNLISDELAEKREGARS